MTYAPTHNQNLATIMLSLVDPRADEWGSVDTVVALDPSVTQELLTMVSAFAAGLLEADAENKQISVEALMGIIEKNVREMADEFDRLDHEGGLFT